MSKLLLSVKKIFYECDTTGFWTVYFYPPGKQSTK